jgi:hypothetical protein
MLELVIFFAIALALAAAAVKLYEWRQHVLYGRYIASERTQSKRPSNYTMRSEPRWLFALSL